MKYFCLVYNESDLFRSNALIRFRYRATSKYEWNIHDYFQYLFGNFDSILRQYFPSGKMQRGQSLRYQGEYVFRVVNRLVGYSFKFFEYCSGDFPTKDLKSRIKCA